MPMLTGDQYRASLRDGRAAYIDGKRIDDVTLNPLLKVSVDWVAQNVRQPPLGARGQTQSDVRVADHGGTTARTDELSSPRAISRRRRRRAV